jgi:hypothetical protein
MPQRGSRGDHAARGQAGGHSVADFEEDARADEADVSERIDRYADELRGGRCW